MHEAACIKASAPLQASAKELLSVDSPTTATFLPTMSGPQTCRASIRDEELAGQKEESGSRAAR